MRCISSSADGEYRVGVNIRIVDDQPAIRAGIRSLLENWPECIVCGEAGDGVEAISKSTQLHPDIVLMDVSMPRMDGLEATRIIRRDIPETPVVIVSQNDPAILCEQARQVNAAAYLSKADISTQLVPILQRLASHRNPRPSSSS